MSALDLQQEAENNYETDLIFPMVEKAASIAGVSFGSAGAKTQAALKVIADHTRAITYLISDGVTPSNIGRGYVLRRLLRRAVMKVQSTTFPMKKSTIHSYRPSPTLRII